MASKKRSHDDDSEPPTNKRRIISSSNGSPLPNGVNEDEPSEEDNLEVCDVPAHSSSFILTHTFQLFRKEAIYRKMKHYSRELSRSQSRVEQLELKRQTCEAGLAAISACWSQVRVSSPYLLILDTDISFSLSTPLRLSPNQKNCCLHTNAYKVCLQYLVFLSLRSTQIQKRSTSPPTFTVLQTLSERCWTSARMRHRPLFRVFFKLEMVTVPYSTIQLISISKPLEPR